MEVLFACREAAKKDIPVEFVGTELNSDTWNRLYHETRMNIPQYVLRRAQYATSRWLTETDMNQHKLDIMGPAAFTEKCMDS